MTARVVHCSRATYDIYVGRPSVWGNPFVVGKDGTREECIERYRTWIVTQAELIGRLHELEGKVLACWCAPKPCHGEVLVELVEAMVAARQQEMR